MINVKDIQKLPDVAAVSASIGLPSLVIIENEKSTRDELNAVGKTMAESGFKKANDYLEVMDLLLTGNEKILYVEQGKKLDDLVLEIVAEYTTGMISLADRKNHTGLKTVKFNPFKTSLAVVMTRSRVEASYPRLYEYFGTITSNE